jgi:hypothetical protein
MKWKLPEPKPDPKEKWHPWFAWHPVIVWEYGTKYLVWGNRVHRRRDIGLLYAYKLIDLPRAV